MVLAVAKNTTRLLGVARVVARRLLGCSGWLLGLLLGVARFLVLLGSISWVQSTP